jgi:hypothetical protein
MDPEPDVVSDKAMGGVLPDHTDVAEGAVADISSDRFDTLVSVISDLASRVDATQRRLDNMHLVPISPTQSADAMPSAGAIPKRPSLLIWLHSLHDGGQIIDMV